MTSNKLQRAAQIAVLKLARRWKLKNCLLDVNCRQIGAPLGRGVATHQLSLIVQAGLHTQRERKDWSGFYRRIMALNPRAFGLFIWTDTPYESAVSLKRGFALTAVDLGDGAIRYDVLLRQRREDDPR